MIMNKSWTYLDLLTKLAKMKLPFRDKQGGVSLPIRENWHKIWHWSNWAFIYSAIITSSLKSIKSSHNTTQNISIQFKKHTGILPIKLCSICFSCVTWSAPVENSFFWIRLKILWSISCGKSLPSSVPEWNERQKRCLKK